MSSLDDLPQRGPTHVLEDDAEQALRNAVKRAGCFLIQRIDRHDYGSDVQLEALENGSPTNFRVHVQLKGTNSAANRDGSVSIGDVERTNLNYLLSTPHACYVGFHAPSQRLLVRSAEDVFSEYEHEHSGWMQQKSITVRFQASAPFDDAFQLHLRDMVIASHRADRDQRLKWTAALPEDVPQLIGAAPKSVRVPADIDQAHAILHELYSAGEDRTISANYSEFKAVLGHETGRMLSAHMAEINLAMNTRQRNDERLAAALSEIDVLLGMKKQPLMDLRYTRANCLSAMRRDLDAIAEYRLALDEKSHPHYRAIGAQCWKNMGSSLERTGADSDAVAAYEEALKLDPDLAEARLALAHSYARRKDFAKAADLVDGLIRRKSSAVDLITIQRWKAHYLSLADSPVKALDVVLDLVGSGHEAKWIWPWSANLVVRIGRSSAEALTKALTYWRRYLHEHPGNKLAERYRLLTLWAVRLHISDTQTTSEPTTVRDGNVEVGFEQFRDAALRLINDKEDEAFWWDRIGHWAQADGVWDEAEVAYRKANDLHAGDYEYCLGTALNHLDRYDEAVPFLRDAASAHDDSMGWHQLGVAHAGRNDWQAAIDAYECAIERDGNAPNPWFNLGGAHWNAGNHADAQRVWEQALERFPNDRSAPAAREFLRALDENSR